MEQIEKYFSYIGLVCIIIFFVIFVTKYVRYWQQLKKAYLQLGMNWPFPTALELNQEMHKDVISAYRKMFKMVIDGWRITLFMRSDNPTIQKPLRGIRRVWLAFIIFPIVLGFVMIIVALVLSGA